MAIVILGIDLGKNVCSLVGVDEDGAAVLRRRMRRQTVRRHVSAFKLKADAAVSELSGDRFPSSLRACGRRRRLQPKRPM